MTAIFLNVKNNVFTDRAIDSALSFIQTFLLLKTVLHPM